MTTPKPPPAVSLAPLDPDAPASEEELGQAGALRDALADPTVANEDAELLRTLSLMESPRPLGAEEHRAILARALAPRHAVRPPARQGARLIRVAFGAGAAMLAVAAAILLLVEPGDLAPPSDQTALAGPPLARVRSTQSLFREPFARQGGESARVDRIAMARASDLRDNEFRRWGVR
jgi:hypothetical protein